MKFTGIGVAYNLVIQILTKFMICFRGWPKMYVIQGLTNAPPTKGLRDDFFSNYSPSGVTGDFLREIGKCRHFDRLSNSFNGFFRVYSVLSIIIIVPVSIPDKYSISCFLND